MRTRTILALTSLTACLFAQAEDLGVYGNVYPIIEQDSILVIKEKAKEWVDKGGMQEAVQQGVDSFKKMITSPDPVPGITNAKEARTFYFTPEKVIEEGIVMPNGLVVIPPGTKANYFTHNPSWPRKLLFIDGRENNQIEWAKKELETDKDLKKLVILMAGSTYETSGKLQQWVYLDFNGGLLNFFGIKSVPASVKQDGINKRLVINEVPQE